MTLDPSLPDAYAQTLVQQRHARWLGLVTFVVVLVAAYALQ